jgi:hypothetical protein
MDLPNVTGRVGTEGRAARKPQVAEGWRTLVRVARASTRHRTTGHAAEMAFFAVLTLVPSTVAVGSALALLRGIVGPGPVADAENGAVRVVRTLMGPDLSEKVIAPFIHAQLSQPKGGVAIGGLLAAWWLSSHLFMATSHALDYAYGVRDRRPTLVQRFIALGFALGSVAVGRLPARGVRGCGPLDPRRGGLPPRGDARPAQLGGRGRRRPHGRDHRPGRQRRRGDGPVGLSRERGDPRGRRAQRGAARGPGARDGRRAEGRGVSPVLEQVDAGAGNDVPRELTSHGQ